MTNTKPNIVYRMDFAIRLMEMGHEVSLTMPNPQKPEFQCWVFKDDETFDRDFKALKATSRGGE